MLSNFKLLVLVSNTLPGVLRVPIEPSPQTAFFGVPDNSTLSLNTKHNDTAFITLLARLRILLLWKYPSPTSHFVWFKDMKIEKKKEKIFTQNGGLFFVNIQLCLCGFGRPAYLLHVFHKLSFFNVFSFENLSDINLWNFYKQMKLYLIYSSFSFVSLSNTFGYKT